ncbi:MAG: phosphoribosylformylglycinamidine synthase subunit PurQ [Actinobacteria bacterium]|jgi:phosphoribosylformylglycinamidine synthase|nr:phosphoribosylformylglycinamidine synthase subunit PurQ [Actinomycetota bacterium]
MRRIGVVVFPGTNCEFDTVTAIERCGGQPELVWHDRRSLAAMDALVLPGGFSYGDYLRPGAIARFSPVMSAVRSFADSGGPVLGICNGFQVLTEAGMLPGALQKNIGLKFICRTVTIRVETTRTPVTRKAMQSMELSLPINHFEGNYTCDSNTLERLRNEERIVLRYVDNPNGSMDSIAGICNEAGNVVGIMPHPERAVDHLLGLEDGEIIFRSLLDTTIGH